MIEYELIRSSRKSLGLEVKRDGRVIVRAPRWAPLRTVRQFVERHRDWIEARLQEAARCQAAQPQAQSPEVSLRLNRSKGSRPLKSLWPLLSGIIPPPEKNE